MLVQQGAAALLLGRARPNPRRGFRIIVCPIFFLLLLSTRQSWSLNISSQPDQGVWGFDGIVHSICRAGNAIYVGGSFTNLLPPTGNQSIPASNLAALDAQTGQPLAHRHQLERFGSCAVRLRAC